MEKDKFILKLVEELEIESVELTEDTKWANVEEYDSMAVLSIIALVDEVFGIQLNAKQISKFITVNDLLKLLNIK